MGSIVFTQGIVDPVSISLEENKWTTLPLRQSRIGGFRIPVPHYLEIPTRLGADIAVDVEFDGTRTYRKEWQSANTTFPQAEVLFTEANCEQNTYRAHYGTHRSRSQLQLPAAKQHRQTQVAQSTRLSAEPRAVAIVENISSMSVTLEQQLVAVCEFVQEMHSGHDRADIETAGFANYWSLPHILDEYYSTGSYSGDCKSVSTLQTGLGLALGIPARRVAGFLTCDEGRFGHTWSELYIPAATPCWVPFDAADPAIDAVLAWPKNATYSITATLPDLIGEAAVSLRVRYE